LESKVYDSQKNPVVVETRLALKKQKQKHNSKGRQTELVEDGASANAPSRLFSDRFTRAWNCFQTLGKPVAVFA
jgi:hypothetical protein